MPEEKTPFEKLAFSHTYDNLGDRSYDEAFGPRGNKFIESGFYRVEESERIRDSKTRAQVRAEESYGGE